MEAKDKIIEVLKNNQELLSSSRIAGIIGIDYNYANKLLEELLSENLIEKTEAGKFTFWKLKNGTQ